MRTRPIVELSRLDSRLYNIYVSAIKTLLIKGEGRTQVGKRFEETGASPEALRYARMPEKIVSTLAEELTRKEVPAFHDQLLLCMSVTSLQSFMI